MAYPLEDNLRWFATTNTHFAAILACALAASACGVVNDGGVQTSSPSSESQQETSETTDDPTEQAAEETAEAAETEPEDETEMETDEPEETPDAEPEMETEEDEEVQTEEPSYTALEFDTSGLSTLANGAHYEGWAIIDGQPVTTGKFNVDASGVPTDLDGIAIPDARFEAGRDLTVASQFVITIEGAGDIDIRPSDTHYLGGELNQLQATLTVDGGTEAFPSDFSTATGSFVLATPTNGRGEDEKSGIWWVDLSVDPPAPGLSLPGLPEGWAYEGWSVIDGQPVSTGRFRAANEADDSAIHSGPMSGPPVPGEDFLMNAPAGLNFPTDLSGSLAVITIEPDPDDSPEPFLLKPLVGEVPTNAVDHQVFQMDNQASETFPVVEATLVE